MESLDEKLGLETPEEVRRERDRQYYRRKRLRARVGISCLGILIGTILAGISSTFIAAQGWKEFFKLCGILMFVLTLMAGILWWACDFDD